MPKSGGTRAVIVEDVAHMIDVRMIDQQDMHAAKRTKPYVPGTFYRSSRRDEHAHAAWIFKQQCSVSDAEFTSRSSKWSDRDVGPGHS